MAANDHKSWAYKIGFKIEPLIDENNQLISIFVKSIQTARKKRRKLRNSIFLVRYSIFIRRPSDGFVVNSLESSNFFWSWFMYEKVLLVDDELDFLEAMAARMRVRGLEVTTTTSTIEALGMSESENFDVIVMDLMMPEMVGLEALKALKDLKPESQIILLTGYATRETEAEALKLGAVDLIEKPADIERLLEKIKEARSKKT
jgi:CheY-like chemotaxis protein